MGYPEAELAFILGFNREVIGFTAGNDVSPRDIEGENPLYLPQAKIFERCCVFRTGKIIFEGSTSTAEMNQSIEELRSYLCKYNPVLPGSVCLTVTGIIPPDEFSLEDKDMVEITIEKIGILRNIVRRL